MTTAVGFSDAALIHWVNQLHNIQNHKWVTLDWLQLAIKHFPDASVILRSLSRQVKRRQIHVKVPSACARSPVPSKGGTQRT